MYINRTRAPPPSSAQECRADGLRPGFPTMHDADTGWSQTCTVVVSETYQHQGHRRMAGRTGPARQDEGWPSSRLRQPLAGLGASQRVESWTRYPRGTAVSSLAAVLLAALWVPTAIISGTRQHPVVTAGAEAPSSGASHLQSTHDQMWAVTAVPSSVQQVQLLIFSGHPTPKFLHI